VKPKRIQLSRKRGWRMPANTVKVDRSTKWGNPYRITDLLLTVFDHNQEICRRACVNSFRDWLSYSPEGRRLAIEAVKELRGKNLACWCKPGDQCHADVLLEIANRPEHAASRGVVIFREKALPTSTLRKLTKKWDCHSNQNR